MVRVAKIYISQVHAICFAAQSACLNKVHQFYRRRKRIQVNTKYTCVCVFVFVYKKRYTLKIGKLLKFTKKLH